jgi:stage II sporulation protein D
MRRLLVALAVLAAVATTASTPTTAAPGSSIAFVLAGGGWGHGVGMSQWGAYGQANAGRDYRQILGYYYRGTELGTAPAGPLDKIRVLVGSGLGSVTVSAPSAIVVVDDAGERYRLPGSASLAPTLELPVGKNGKVVALPGPLTLRATGGANLAFSGKTYRGDIQVSKAGGRLQLVNVVGLEAYLLGVVPGEMPKDWPLEALKAQAVAARTYAIGHLLAGKSYDLTSDWRSQLYYGVGSEAPGTTQAVKETRGQIVTYDGKPAQALYFSSSGGRTISALDAFGADLPYLVAVDDPWDETSPNHVWPTQLMTGAQLARQLGLDEAVEDVTYVPGTPGKPAVVRLTIVGGKTADVRLSDVRARLGLKSTGFRLGVLRLDRPAPLSAGGVLRLTGVARDIADVELEQRGSSGAWVTVKRLAPSANGTFAIKLKITATTVYRLAAGGLAGPSVTVRVTA